MVVERMNSKDLLHLGVPLGEPMRRATDFINQFVLRGGDKTQIEDEVKAIVANPSAFRADPLRGEFARALLAAPPLPRAEPVKYRQWGEGLEPEAVMQMEKACLLPVSIAGALMPDAHVGYGLPIGGVLATDNAVIPSRARRDVDFRRPRRSTDGLQKHSRGHGCAERSGHGARPVRSEAGQDGAERRTAGGLSAELISFCERRW